jgi:hypothetical protein
MIDVEPLIISELELMLPLPAGDRADWGDVMRRAGFRRAHRRWRPVLVTALVVAGIVGVGVAIAAGFGAFNGISAAQRPQTPADRLDPKLLFYINRVNGSRGAGEQLLPDSARLIRRLPGNVRIYAVATNDGQLCVLAERLPNNNGKDDALGMVCGSPLTQTKPSSAATFARNESSPAITWGIALDSVAAVSFMAGGHEVTVPVTNNVWAYEGADPNYGTLTAHFKDGRREPIG